MTLPTLRRGSATVVTHPTPPALHTDSRSHIALFARYVDFAARYGHTRLRPSACGSHLTVLTPIYLRLRLLPLLFPVPHITTHTYLITVAHSLPLTSDVITLTLRSRTVVHLPAVG